MQRLVQFLQETYGKVPPLDDWKATGSYSAARRGWSMRFSCQGYETCTSLVAVARALGLEEEGKGEPGRVAGLGRAAGQDQDQEAAGTGAGSAAEATAAAAAAAVAVAAAVAAASHPPEAGPGPSQPHIQPGPSNAQLLAPAAAPAVAPAVAAVPADGPAAEPDHLDYLRRNLQERYGLQDPQLAGWTATGRPRPSGKGYYCTFTHSEHGEFHSVKDVAAALGQQMQAANAQAPGVQAQAAAAGEAAQESGSGSRAAARGSGVGARRGARGAAGGAPAEEPEERAPFRQRRQGGASSAPAAHAAGPGGTAGAATAATATAASPGQQVPSLVQAMLQQLLQPGAVHAHPPAAAGNQAAQAPEPGEHHLDMEVEGAGPSGPGVGLTDAADLPLVYPVPGTPEERAAAATFPPPPPEATARKGKPWPDLALDHVAQTQHMHEAAAAPDGPQAGNGAEGVWLVDQQLRISEDRLQAAAEGRERWQDVLAFPFQELFIGNVGGMMREGGGGRVCLFCVPTCWCVMRPFCRLSAVPAVARCYHPTLLQSEGQN